MNGYHEHTPDEQLERYLDGLLSEEERAEFEQRLQQDPALESAVRAEAELQAKLRASFTPRDVSLEEISGWFRQSEVSQKSAASKPSRRLAVVAAIVAAAAVWMFALTNWNRGTRDIQPFFERRPLVALYQETIEQGFRPYYFCEDEERFARTFRKRQDVPLALRSLPDDRRMVGLSYLGGLSRDTTAMLAYADDTPIVVFVDRTEADDRVVATKSLAEFEQLRVHRSELGELVVYEVSPFDAAKMAPYLQIDE